MHCIELATCSGMQKRVCLSVQIPVHESSPVQSPGFTLTPSFYMALWAIVRMASQPYVRCRWYRARGGRPALMCEGQRSTLYSRSQLTMREGVKVNSLLAKSTELTNHEAYSRSQLPKSISNWLSQLTRSTPNLVYTPGPP